MTGQAARRISVSAVTPTRILQRLSAMWASDHDQLRLSARRINALQVVGIWVVDVDVHAGLSGSDRGDRLSQPLLVDSGAVGRVSAELAGR